MKQYRAKVRPSFKPQSMSAGYAADLLVTGPRAVKLWGALVALACLNCLRVHGYVAHARPASLHLQLRAPVRPVVASSRDSTAAWFSPRPSVSTPLYAAADEAEGECPCSDLGRADAAAQEVGLLDVCAVGDVVLVVLTEEEQRRFGDGCSSALVVVDGEDRVSYLCLRDPDSSEWYRDSREAEAVTCKGNAVIHVLDNAAYSQRCIPSLGGGQGYGAEAEDTWLIADTSDVALLAQYHCRIPVDPVGTAPWMQT